METVLAEKPGVAREIALVLGATEKKRGYLTGNGYFVTWAFGHLVALGMPEDYGISGFQEASLPILPDPFLLRVRKMKKGKKQVEDPGASEQLKIIERLFKRSENIIVATDAGREGELIFRYIYTYLKCKKPFQRLWISSLTEKAIKKGFENLKPGKEFEGLFQAAQGRSRADWLIGINATQALTIAAGRGVYSLGRVQTPTLALLCKRYFENKEFTSRKYWKIQLAHTKHFIDFKSTSNKNWENLQEAENALRSIQRSGQARVQTVELKKITEQPPLLYDLTGLQKEANKKLGLSASETLKIAQNLYEKRFITYPRTGSKYIPEDIWPEIPDLVRALGDKQSCKPAVDKIRWGRFNRRIVNDLKVTDHHGLLVTEKIPSALNVKEDLIYDRIALRLLESISQACIKEVSKVAIQVTHYDFIAKGNKILEPGWRALQGNFGEDEAEPAQELPELEGGMELQIKEAKVLEKKTKPPSLYTEASLLAAMENAGREIENEQARKALQGIGMGTPATRAAIIETLFSRNYMERKKKVLLPTKKGLQVFELVKDFKIADVSMTAEWELHLQKIEKGQADAIDFQKETEKYAAAITAELLKASNIGEDLPELTCPKCKSRNLIIREKIVKCSDEKCGWKQFRNICGVQIGIADIERLITQGKTSLIKGMKSRSGKRFSAYITLNDQGESSFEFEKKKSFRSNGK